MRRNARPKTRIPHAIHAMHAIHDTQHRNLTLTLTQHLTQHLTLAPSQGRG